MLFTSMIMMKMTMAKMQVELKDDVHLAQAITPYRNAGGGIKLMYISIDFEKNRFLKTK